MDGFLTVFQIGYVMCSVVKFAYS